MLQAHSFFWHYLWLAPHILQLALVAALWRRGLYRLFPFFFLYAIFEAFEEFTLYAMDVLPSVGGEAFWQAFSIGLVIEGLIRFAVIGELFYHLLRAWPVLARVGSKCIRGTGAVLVLLASLAAAYAPIDNPEYSLVSRAHILQQALYIVQAGLVLFLFLFAAYFKLIWENRTFGIALGLGLLSCEHLATWALMANGGLLNQRNLLDLLNMATYHLCVLIWSYYLLIPQKSATTSAVSLPENNLAVWNRELERLLQQ